MACASGVLVESEEIVCPVCYEEFEEPKCLPSCAHNVCYQCLQRMVRTNSKNINCPVCREVSKIPPGGVAGFPKNHLLANLVNRMPGRREKKMLSKSLKKCKEQTEVLRNSYTGMKTRFEIAQENAEETRREIKTIASRAVQRVKEQERDLIEQVNLYMRNNFSLDVHCKYEEDIGDLLADASSWIDSCQELLDKGDLKDLKEAPDGIVKQLDVLAEAAKVSAVKANCRFTVNYCLTLSKPSESLVNFLRNGSLGKLGKDTEATSLSGHIDFSDQCGSLIGVIDGSDIGDYGFNPMAVAVSGESGNLAIVDKSKKRVHIVNLEGEKQLKSIQIQHGDLWDVAFTKGDEVVVTNRERNRILHYDRNGRFQKKLVEVPSSHGSSLHKLKFTHISIDSDGRYIVTSSPSGFATEDADPGVCVYSPEREFEMIFGTQGELGLPRKALWHKGEFYVPDLVKEAVVVFDEDGKFCREIGKYELTQPRSMAIDSVNDNILVCDFHDDSIKIFKSNGTFVSKFYTDGGNPFRMALSKDEKKVIILLKDEYGSEVVNILSYIP